MYLYSHMYTKSTHTKNWVLLLGTIYQLQTQFTGYLLLLSSQFGGDGLEFLRKLPLLSFQSCHFSFSCFQIFLEGSVWYGSWFVSG